MKKLLSLFLLIFSIQAAFIGNAQDVPSITDTTLQKDNSDSLGEEPSSNQKTQTKSVFINDLPQDLSSATLVILLFEESTDYFKNKNMKYKERFKEYPYPILFVEPSALEAALANNKYLLVDLSRRAIEQRFRGKAGGGFELDTKHVTYHNYCIQDNRNPGTYYRLVKWIDCEKGGEIFCLKRFIKGVLKEKED
jgi:hypothetical protein